MEFLRHPIFVVTALLQIAGPLIFGYSMWCNHIQYISLFGMAYGLWVWVVKHRADIEHIKQQLEKVGRHDSKGT